jgi:flagellin-like protein
MHFKLVWKDREGVSPVIAVILLVAITVVLVSVLYFTVAGMVEETKPTPIVAIDFNEHDTIEGMYIGGVVSMSEEVKLSQASLTLIDVESGDSGAIHPLVTGGETSAGSGADMINITFTDGGMTGKLEPSDVFVITGATEGDKVVLTYIPSDDILAFYIIPP